MVMLGVYALGIGLGPGLHYSLLAEIAADPGVAGVGVAALVQATGVTLLLLGWSALVWRPVVRWYGRRGVYLLSVLLVVPLMEWAAHARSAGDWFGHRLLLGIVAAPAEFLPAVTVADVWCGARERGTWMAAWLFALTASHGCLAPLVSGFLGYFCGWRWAMHLGAIVAAAVFVVLFFFLDETLFPRDVVEEEIELQKGTGRQARDRADVHPQNDPSQSRPDDSKPDDDRPDKSDDRTDKPDDFASWYTDTASDPESAPSKPTLIYPPKPSLWQRLRPFSPHPRRLSFRQVAASIPRPLAALAYVPTTTWAGLQSGAALAWTVLINGTISPVLTSPSFAYTWPARSVGLAFLGPLVGAAIAASWTGAFSCWCATGLARHRAAAAGRLRGLCEPEDRLWALPPAAVLAAAGLVTWGGGAAHAVPWPGLVFGLGMVAFGCVGVTAATAAYEADCIIGGGGGGLAGLGLNVAAAATAGVRRAKAGAEVEARAEAAEETGVALVVVRDTIGFAVSFGVTPWWKGMGLQNCGVTAAVVAAVVGVGGTVPVLAWGKRLRWAIANGYWRFVGGA